MSDNSLTVMPPNKPGPASDHELVISAQQMIHRGNRAEAYNLVVQALNANPDNITALYLYGQLSPDRPKAIQALRKVLYVQPGHTEARLLLDRLESASQPAQQPPPPQMQPPTPQQPYDPMMQQMMAQHHMLMQQQMVNQQQIAQQQLLNQQQFAQQNMYPYAAPPVAMVVSTQNDGAFWAGFLLAFFVGIFGVAHMANNKVGTGIVYLFLGFVWDAIYVVLAITVFGLIIGIPLHILFAYACAKGGASMPMAFGAYPYRRW